MRMTLAHIDKENVFLAFIVSYFQTKYFVNSNNYNNYLF